MPPLLRTIVRWGAVELLLVQGVGGWLAAHRIIPAVLIYPLSWAVYFLAGWEAAGSGRVRDAAIAGGGIGALEQFLWLAQGAAGHADTSDLPWIVSILTYVTTVLVVVLIGAAFGALGGVVIRRRAQASTASPPPSIDGAGV